MKTGSLASSLWTDEGLFHHLAVLMQLTYSKPQLLNTAILNDYVKLLKISVNALVVTFT